MVYIIEFKNTAFRKASQAPLIRLLEIVGESGVFKCGLCMPAFSRLATSPLARSTQPFEKNKRHLISLAFLLLGYRGWEVSKTKIKLVNFYVKCTYCCTGDAFIEEL